MGCFESLAVCMLSFVAFAGEMPKGLEGIRLGMTRVDLLSSRSNLEVGSAGSTSTLLFDRSLANPLFSVAIFAFDNGELTRIVLERIATSSHVRSLCPAVLIDVNTALGVQGVPMIGSIDSPGLPTIQYPAFVWTNRKARYTLRCIVSEDIVGRPNMIQLFIAGSSLQDATNAKLRQPLSGDQQRLIERYTRHPQAGAGVFPNN